MMMMMTAYEVYSSLLQTLSHGFINLYSLRNSQMKITYLLIDRIMCLVRLQYEFAAILLLSLCTVPNNTVL